VALPAPDGSRDTPRVDEQPGPAAFDHADADELERRLTVCLASEEWARRVVVGRPYRTLEALESAAMAAALALSDEGLAEALAAHPRIGERPDGDDEAAAHSRREQAGVQIGAQTDDATAERLRLANRAYEERFGHVFLVRAAGRSAEEVLRLAQDRLGNDPLTEAGIVRHQLGEIAVLRLQDLLDALVQEAAAPDTPVGA
jgi:2-oxo-4-hydroxy-4-carboxy-5-ureidoimidazoline decarboxylase